MRIGVFGGSFDPIHHGHLIVARAARDALRLDQVRFVPARAQPFKAGTHAATPADRLAMVEAAIAGESGFVADSCEIDRPEPSYTIDTLRDLHTRFPGDELFLLVGADAARDLPQWRDAGSIGELATIVILTRPGAAAPAPGLAAAGLTVPAVDISASTVRAHCAAGTSIQELVPPAVCDLIAQRRLYRERA